MTPLNTQQILKASENLSYLIRESIVQRGMAESEIQDLELQHNNIIHEIERSNNCRERSKLATQLSKVRRERRKLKDWLKSNEPYFNYLGSADGDKVQNMIANLVGVGRKIHRKL